MEAELGFLTVRSPTTAVLGPTNTGKTHLAMERMLASPSGMIGFPLRLLARENYERAVLAKGPDAVALITGEEKITPPGARYFLCTVESMPLSRPVSFLAIDEIQMCADPDRGYVFTERLLRARGEDETMFLGAETIRPLLRRLTPNAQTVTRPRFSTLAYTGPSKISRLPPRSAVVAFNVADVYSIAELIRRERGGAAIVLGALSPRTRNAQVSMYQAGDVDYLVATDAIGMGLNMDINHISFASTRKFDGRVRRDLSPAELAQIAGRAGRHTRNGTFGTTTGIGALTPVIIDQIETHQFAPLKSIFWRNNALEFRSIDALKASLARPPERPGLSRTRTADDEQALTLLTRDPDIARRAAGREAVSLLWDVCQIPDFGKMMTDGHARLLGVIYRFLAEIDRAGQGRLPTDWVSRQVDHLNRVDGDIEVLMQRIALIRIWTYIAQRPNWLEDCSGWQQRTRRIEDKLSDTLHERLVQRFVDRRMSNLYARIRERQVLAAYVSSEGEVFVEGHSVGTLQGFEFVPKTPSTPHGGRGAERLINAAAMSALRTEITQRVRKLESSTDDAFDFNESGQILWHGASVARLDSGASILAPKVALLANELLKSQDQIRLRGRLSRWLTSRLRRDFKPLFALANGPLSGIAGGLLYQVAEGLGSVSRQSVHAQISGLSPSHRRALKEHGLRLGRRSVYYPGLLKPKHLRIRALLWAAHQKQRPPPPKGDAMSVPIGQGNDAHFCEATGFVRLGPRAVRVDLLERFSLHIERCMRRQVTFHPAQMSALIGCPAKEIPEIVSALGYQVTPDNGGLRIDRRQPQIRRSRKNNRARGPGVTASDPSSPFARLRELRPVT